LYPSATTVLIQDYLARIDEEPFDLLTSREREVLKLIADGYTSRQIADQLYLSLKTVLGHRTRIMDKLDIHNKAELIKYVIKEGLVAVDNIDNHN
jgi:two-component system response regulator NreC